MQAKKLWYKDRFTLFMLAMTSLEFNPMLQAWKGLQTGHMEDISLGMFLTTTAIGLVWGAYGIHSKNAPLIAGNGIKFASNVAVLAVYYYLK